MNQDNWSYAAGAAKEVFTWVHRLQTQVWPHQTQESWSNLMRQSQGVLPQVYCSVLLCAGSYTRHTLAIPCGYMESWCNGVSLWFGVVSLLLMIWHAYTSFGIFWKERLFLMVPIPTIIESTPVMHTWGSSLISWDPFQWGSWCKRLTLVFASTLMVFSKWGYR